MHNFYLMKLLDKDLNISKISVRNKINYNFYKNNNLNYIPIKVPIENIVKSLNKYRFLKKILIYSKIGWYQGQCI